MNEQVKEILEWYEVEKFNIFDVDSPDLFEALRQAYESSLPEVTDTPPMPKVKDPKPEDTLDIPVSVKALNWLIEQEQARQLAEKSDLPRKEVISIQPGDVAVIKADASINEKGQDYIRKQLNNTFPDNKTIILDQGMSLEVYREQGKPSKAANCPGNCKTCNARCIDRLEAYIGEQIKEKVAPTGNPHLTM
jgi:hypothetical protein